MPDIAVSWDTANARGDWSVASGDLATGADLATAVYVSLFTDRRADNDFTPPDGSGDRRGWWGDTYAATDGDQIGSLLWTLYRAKITNRTAFLSQVQGYCLDALQWLLDDGVAASVSVTTSWGSGTQINIGVTIAKPSGSVLNFQYAWAWSGV